MKVINNLKLYQYNTGYKTSLILGNIDTYNNSISGVFIDELYYGIGSFMLGWGLANITLCNKEQKIKLNSNIKITSNNKLIFHKYKLISIKGDEYLIPVVDLNTKSLKLYTREEYNKIVFPISNRDYIILKNS